MCDTDFQCGLSTATEQGHSRVLVESGKHPFNLLPSGLFICFMFSKAFLKHLLCARHYGRCYEDKN